MYKRNSFFNSRQRDTGGTYEQDLKYYMTLFSISDWLLTK